MLDEDKYFYDLTEGQVWQRYCGFLKLSIDEFMQIQRELLMDEIERVADSVLGKKIMGDQKPGSVEEFRQIVPLTTYDDYQPYLSERREDALAEKPYCWVRSSGRGGYVKWGPVSSKCMGNNLRDFLASFILATASKEGEVNIKPGFHLLTVIPPPPYGSGTFFNYMAQHFSYKAIPPLEDAERLDFQARMRKGLLMALRDGLDCAMSLSSIFAKIGEGFSEQTSRMEFSPYMLHPSVIFRMLRARLHTMRTKRPILPKDLWPLKGIIAGGTDCSIYKDDILHYWGVEPYEFYVATETSGMSAMEGWNRKGLVFLPDVVFLEFIPEEESLKSVNDTAQQTSTILLNEVEQGKLYEVVVTQFNGMPLLRYRMKDIFKVVALRDDEAGINLPHFVFQHRIGDTIDLAGLCTLDEKTIWRAIVDTGIRCTEWSSSKEYAQDRTFLRLYLELREEREVADVENAIDGQLKVIDEDYRDIDYYLQDKPVRVTLLTRGTFERYADAKREKGVDLAFLKPTHVNPPEADIQLLLRSSEVGQM